MSHLEAFFLRPVYFQPIRAIKKLSKSSNWSEKRQYFWICRLGIGYLV